MSIDQSLVLLMIALIVGLAFISLIVFIASGLNPKKKQFQKKWQAILAQKDPKIAILRADSLLDEAMRVSRIHGETTGERLNNAKGIVRDLNGVWSAHKIRNKIAHESSFEPSKKAATEALKQFRQAIRDMGLL